MDKQRIETVFCVKCGHELKLEQIALIQETEPIHYHRLFMNFCPAVRCELYKVYQKGLADIEVGLKKNDWMI